MKKLFLSVCMLCFLTASSYAQTPVVPSGVAVVFSTQLVDPTSSTINHPRGPVCPPEAKLSGHALYIMTSHGDDSANAVTRSTNFRYKLKTSTICKKI